MKKKKDSLVSDFTPRIDCYETVHDAVAIIMYTPNQRSERVDIDRVAIPVEYVDRLIEKMLLAKDCILKEMQEEE